MGREKEDDAKIPGGSSPSILADARPCRIAQEYPQLAGLPSRKGRRKKRRSEKEIEGENNVEKENFPCCCTTDLENGHLVG